MMEAERGGHKQEEDGRAACLLCWTASAMCEAARDCARKDDGSYKKKRESRAIVLSLLPPASSLPPASTSSSLLPPLLPTFYPGSEAKTIFILLLISGNFSPFACQRRSLAPRPVSVPGRFITYCYVRYALGTCPWFSLGGLYSTVASPAGRISTPHPPPTPPCSVPIAAKIRPYRNGHGSSSQLILVSSPLVSFQSGSLAHTHTHTHKHA